MEIKIIIADDHPAVLLGLMHELSAISSLQIIGQANNSTQIIELLSTFNCDVLITDFIMPGGSVGDGMDMLLFLRRHYQHLKIIVFTAVNNQALMAEMLKLGVNSVLNKADGVSHIISALYAVHTGAIYISPQFDTTAQNLSHYNNKKLTLRESEVMKMYISGLSVGEIADLLKRKKQTVSSQKSSAMRKLGITSDADLFRFAYETGCASFG
ncbi:response regulator [Aeromonas hydrophila]